ncbi:MAG: tRNA pseudouridine(55) synthase TruB, partial [Clostridia bacterium]|nr:tRNA pseudouridine(55) synthase TruB [Clostridia bacterium]
MNGFINIIKPVGATASDIVVCLKNILHERKVGHLGTLDPGASGVLPVAVGQATKLFSFLTDKIKYYRAFFTFGKTTDTLDSYGIVTERNDVCVDTDIIRGVLSGFVGEFEQMPPSYSAKSVDGVRAYKLARNGVDVSLSPKKITVYEIELISKSSDDTYVFDIKCGGGTYIRSL